MRVGISLINEFCGTVAFKRHYKAERNKFRDFLVSILDELDDWHRQPSPVARLHPLHQWSGSAMLTNAFWIFLCDHAQNISDGWWGRQKQSAVPMEFEELTVSRATVTHWLEREHDRLADIAYQMHCGTSSIPHTVAQFSDCLFSFCSQGTVASSYVMSDCYSRDSQVSMTWDPEFAEVEEVDATNFVYAHCSQPFEDDAVWESVETLRRARSDFKFKMEFLERERVADESLTSLCLTAAAGSGPSELPTVHDQDVREEQMGQSSGKPPSTEALTSEERTPSTVAESTETFQCHSITHSLTDNTQEGMGQVSLPLPPEKSWTTPGGLVCGPKDLHRSSSTMIRCGCLWLVSGVQDTGLPSPVRFGYKTLKAKIIWNDWDVVERVLWWPDTRCFTFPLRLQFTQDRTAVELFKGKPRLDLRAMSPSDLIPFLTRWEQSMIDASLRQPCKEYIPYDTDSEDLSVDEEHQALRHRECKRHAHQGYMSHWNRGTTLLRNVKASPKSPKTMVRRGRGVVANDTSISF
eukprot:Blabericola_migrator_1__4675@NODE_2471_length_2711_cov_114_631997_g1548_i0_p1_GENE_NODE_2471_length_2711_cov_114_631997_g1548_i0NODE_2471_length_2711_cov_114_631997_g1548_i0_p1_ORF_typecomplete_len522_score46_96_NODE_2471_length_2711_cov_114_631997_g1548_i010892654